MSFSEPTEATTIDALMKLIERLRSPDGCAWDRAQNWADLRPYLLEEAHEVADALDREDWTSLKEELGDLLFQLCFLAQLAREARLFDIADVIASVHRKMVERHPHVFGESAGSRPTREQVTQAWERRKLDAASATGASLLDGVASSLPALTAAYRLGQKAAGVGFDWTDRSAVLDKVDEELDELRAALSASQGAASAPSGDGAIEEELGDLFFVLASLSRHLGVDPERALARANLKFRRRFTHVESGIAPGSSGAPSTRERERMEELWNEAKRAEAPSGRPKA